MDLQEASTDDFGIPIPVVMEKLINRYVPAPRIPGDDSPRCHQCSIPFLTACGKWGMYCREGKWYCFACIGDMNDGTGNGCSR